MSELKAKLDVISDLKDTFLECPVCVEHFNQTDRRPRLLHSCLHAFCTPCLQQLLEKEGQGQITCPLCRQVQKVESSVDALPVDPVRSKLVEYLRIKHKQKVLCTECSKEFEAVSRCQHCKTYLCVDCEYVHKNHRVSKSHPIVTIEQVIEAPLSTYSKAHFCPIHPQHCIEFFCIADQQMCCLSCTVLDHKGHDLQSLEQAASVEKERLEGDMKEIHEALQGIHESVRKTKKQERYVLLQRDLSMSIINKTFEDVSQLLNARKQACLQTVKKGSDALLSRLHSVSAVQDQSLAVIESAETYFAEAKTKADDVDLLQICPAITRSCKAVAQPDMLQDTGIYNSCKAIMFQLVPIELLQDKISGIGSFSAGTGTGSESQNTSLTSGTPGDAPPSLPENCKFRIEDIYMEMKLGDGTFADVYRAMYKPLGLVVIAQMVTDDKEKHVYLEDGLLLKFYEHPNIVRFLGSAPEHECAMIVLEYVKDGLRLSRYLRENGKTLTKVEMTEMCVDVASGMVYLEGMGCLHRHLTTWNCIIGKNKVVKISGFGKSHQGECDMTETLSVPTRWTAPEIFENTGKWTTKSDVWSYAIVMWAVFACGEMPYNGKSYEEAYHQISKGYRMPHPEGTPPGVGTLMSQCWQEKPEDRPRFKEISSHLNRLIGSL